MYISNSKKTFIKRANIFTDNSSNEHSDLYDNEDPKFHKELQHMIDSKRQKTKNMETFLQELKKEHDCLQIISSSNSALEHSLHKEFIDIQEINISPFSESSNMSECDKLENLSSDSEDELNIIINPESKAHLRNSQRKKLDYALRNLTCYRNHIAYVMTYCIRHSEASEEIVRVITESILSPEADSNKKIARLYLLSDILYNSNSSIDGLHLWKYRTFIENKLVSIVEHWKEISSSMGRLKMNHMKRIMLILLDIWSTWRVFPFSTIDSLKNAFIENIGYDDIDGVPLED